MSPHAKKSNARTPPLYVMGDIHGLVDQLLGHLVRAELVDTNLQWTGGRSRLWLVGDLFNRGTDGLGVVNLVRLLQSEAQMEGGEVGALLGNHDLFFLSAHRFGGDEWAGSSFVRNWLNYGGEPSDLAGLSEEHADWLESLPVLKLVDEILISHADATMYLNYGTDVRSVNSGVADIIASHDTRRWQQLLIDFSERHSFDDTNKGGDQRLNHFLDTFGAQKLIHGHTPIDKITHQNPKDVKHAYTYAKGRCVNVDGGMYRGGPGFLYRAR